ncbi:GNAT family N-acetyltransferase [Nocardioides hwasunensis]|uniref:GNAT family N-acetyltransferase n=1 Tax=Nocardioides hwasunensis TaxID=397258 RepID=A0ABR8ME33_9ACTN|nr:hypothetical protein [Nocardioides hwasunensis]MBD3914379.1 hypothetical protein [Nocardioides hwasunensis]
MAGSLRIAPLTRAHALDICTWRYEPPYSSYDMTGADPDWLLQPVSGFHAVLACDDLVGFRSYGEDGRVPGWAYDDQALDTGGGLRPSLTGSGLGPSAIAAGLAHGRVLHDPPAFRVTVASSNARALHVVEGLGFERVASFVSTHDGQDFEVLVRSER